MISVELTGIRKTEKKNPRFEGSCLLFFLLNLLSIFKRFLLKEKINL